MPSPRAPRSAARPAAADSVAASAASGAAVASARWWARPSSAGDAAASARCSARRSGRRARLRAAAASSGCAGRTRSPSATADAGPERLGHGVLARDGLEPLHRARVERAHERRSPAGAPGEQERHRVVAEPPGGEGQRVRGRRVEPLHVVDGHEHRRLRGERAERVAQTERDRLRLGRGRARGPGPRAGARAPRSRR
jgi:hypothetical protein